MTNSENIQILKTRRAEGELNEMGQGNPSITCLSKTVGYRDN